MCSELLMMHLKTIFGLFEVCMHEILKQYVFNLTLPVTVQVIFSAHSHVIKWELILDHSHLENSNNIVLKMLVIYRSRVLFWFCMLYIF